MQMQLSHSIKGRFQWMFNVSRHGLYHKINYFVIMRAILLFTVLSMTVINMFIVLWVERLWKLENTYFLMQFFLLHRFMFHLMRVKDLSWPLNTWCIKDVNGISDCRKYYHDCCCQLNLWNFNTFHWWNKLDCTYRHKLSICSNWPIIINNCSWC